MQLEKLPDPIILAKGEKVTPQKFNQLLKCLKEMRELLLGE